MLGIKKVKTTSIRLSSDDGMEIFSFYFRNKLEDVYCNADLFYTFILHFGMITFTSTFTAIDFHSYNYLITTVYLVLLILFL